MLRWLDKVPLVPLAVAAVLLGLSPGLTEPHLVQKLRLLYAGQLDQPLDIFDLILHASLPLVLLLKFLRMLALERRRRE
jgi:hypothetical protein